MAKYTIFKILPIIILSSFLLILSESYCACQESMLYPETVVDEYFSENYNEAATLASNHFQNVIGASHDSLKQGFVIRLAFLSAWSENIVTAEIYNRGWSQVEEKDSIPPNSWEIADHYAIYSVIANLDRRYKDALDTLQLSINHRLPTNRLEKAILADCYQFMGVLNAQLGDYAKAIASYREAKTINLGNKRKAANYQIEYEMAKSRIFLNPGEPSILDSLNNCLEYFIREEKTNLIVNTYNEIGNFYLSDNNNIEAAKQFRISLDLRIKTHNLDEINVAFNNLGAAFNLLNQADSAIFYFYQAIAHTPDDNYNQAANYHNNLGAQFGKLNKPDSALYHFSHAINLIFPYKISNSLNELGNLKILSPILPVFLANQGNAKLDLYYDTREHHWLTESVQTLEYAVDLLDQLRYMSSFESKNFSVRENRGFYFLALEAAIEQYKDNPTTINFQTVFNFSYKAKSAVFNEYQRVLNARDSMMIDQTLIQKDDSLKRLLTQTSQELIQFRRLGPDWADSVAHRNSLLINLDLMIQDHSKVLRQKYPAYYNYIHTPDQIDYTDIQAKLEKDEVIIDFTYSADLIAALLIARDNISIHTETLSDDFIAKIEDYRNFFARFSKLGFSDFIGIGYDLYMKLLEPFKDQILDKDLIIITDGPLGYIPFDTFCTCADIPVRKNYSELPMLVKTTTISLLNSIQQFHDARNFHSDNLVSVQAFAPFTDTHYYYNEYKLPQLMGSRRELRSISNHMASHSHQGSKASLSKFHQVRNQGDILHLATHGILSSDNPMDNLLIFSPEGQQKHKLHLYDVINLSIKSPLVVLSACDTGTGDLFEGEGIMSVTRGFHFAGVPAVIMSLWPAYDRPAVVIMDNFYRELGQGLGTAESLRQAKLNYLISASSAESHPSLWANYQLSGINSKIPLKNKFGWPLLLGLISGLILMYFVVKSLGSRFGKTD